MFLEIPITLYEVHKKIGRSNSRHIDVDSERLTPINMQSNGSIHHLVSRCYLKCRHNLIITIQVIDVLPWRFRHYHPSKP